MASEPRLYLIGRPSLEQSGLTAFLADRTMQHADSPDSTPAEHLVEICGRLCYMSFSEDTSKIRYPNEKYIENLIEQAHDSVLEHANWTFILDNVSRALTHQLVRHRVGFAFSQLSQQYHEEHDAEFVEPPGLTQQAQAEWKASLEGARRAYARLLAFYGTASDATMNRKETLRLARSAARSVLPNATKTAIAVTANARALRHFLKVRGTITGDIEMRLVAAEIYRMLSEEAPALVAGIELQSREDGWPIISTTAI